MEKKSCQQKQFAVLIIGKKYCPDYEIIEWNEDNYDVYQNPYTAYAYDNKKFAFLSDYARLQIVLKEGGLYFDVDVEIVRPLDELLDHKTFLASKQKNMSILDWALEPRQIIQL